MDLYFMRETKCSRSHYKSNSGGGGVLCQIYKAYVSFL